MLRLLESFSFVISLAIVAGVLIGGFPAYGNEIATLALIIAMTLSISNIPFKVEAKEIKHVFVAFLLNYGLLSAFIISLGYLMHDYFEGFIVMAAAPPAIAIVPLSSVLKGDRRHSLFSVIFLYIAAIFMMPLIIYFFLAKEVNSILLVKNVVLLILLPMLLSRIIYGKIEERRSRIITNFCFFFLVFSVIGKNRQFIFEEVSLLLFLSIAMAARTIGIGLIVKSIASKMGIEKSKIVNYTLFSSFKNEGLVMIIASSLFSYETALPAVIALIFEMIWICCMESKII